MILPSKYLQENDALIGVGATLLNLLKEECSLSDLWDRAKHSADIGSFERFILGLDILFILGAIKEESGRIKKVMP